MTTETAGGRDGETSIGRALEELLAATHQLEFAVSSIDAFGDSELSFADLFTLATISSGGEQPMSQLALKLRISRQRLNRILRQLEKRGLVGVKGGEEDARIRLVSITAAGETTLGEMRRQLHMLAEKLGSAAPKVHAVTLAASTAKRLSAAAWKLRATQAKAAKAAGSAGS